MKFILKCFKHSRKSDLFIDKIQMVYLNKWSKIIKKQSEILLKYLLNKQKQTHDSNPFYRKHNSDKPVKRNSYLKPRQVLK